MAWRALGVLIMCVACGPPPPPVWQEGDGFRWRELDVPSGPEAGFAEVSARRAGITLVNDIDQDLLLANRHRSHGSGVTLGDVDGDGRLDVYLGRVDGPNALYRNRGGWKFDDITDEAGVGAADLETTGVLFVDVDGDDDLDLLVAALGATTRLYLNDGAGRFSERADAGLVGERGTTTLTMADIDGDGDLDLYETNYKVASVTDMFPPEERSFDAVVGRAGDSAFVVDGMRPHYRLRRTNGEWRREDRAEADVLYLNDGSGRFDAVTYTDRFRDEAGRRLPAVPDYFGLAARFYDVDDDGDPDLYVCNDFMDPDFLWINDGSGHFHLADQLALRTTSQSTMAVDFADVDRDGDTDFFQVDMLSRSDARRKRQIAMHDTDMDAPGVLRSQPQIQRNSLFLNRGDGTYAQVAAQAGVTASEWSWGTAFLDVDLDGYEDILVTTGHPWDVNDIDTRERLANGPAVPWRREVLEFPPYRTGNVLFLNRGDGTFADRSAQLGFDVGEDVSHGIAMGDLDDDGDADVIITRLHDPPLLLRNEASGPRVHVRLIGQAPNTNAVGARIRLVDANGFAQEREVTVGGLYVSGPDPAVSFAAGPGPMTLEVTWPSGSVAALSQVEPDRAYQVREADLPGGPPDVREVTAPFFEDATTALAHVHPEGLYDDFRRQPMLPGKLSQAGPAVVWNDLDADGDDDLVVGTGAGGRLAVFENRNGSLRAVETGPAIEHDLTGLVVIPGAAGKRILGGVSSHETGNPVQALGVETVRAWRVGPGLTVRNQGSLLPGDTSSVGHLAAADVDGDGDLDLFVGGRSIPGGYPIPATSRIWINHDGTFSLDTENTASFRNVGLVSGAVFTDIDQDHEPDLVLALDWGPIRVFVNNDGRFRDVSEAWGTAELYGNWKGVNAVDVDADGDLDMVVTGPGDNGRYGPLEGNPVTVYFGDFDRNGILDLLETRVVDGEDRPMNRLSRLSIALPGIRRRVQTFEQYSTMDVADVLGVDPGRIASATSAHSRHLVLVNEGNRFAARPLPALAQAAPAHQVVVADYNGDGREDLFLSQNFYPAEPGTARMDAGRGLWLTGDGRGGFVPFENGSGIRVYGDQRGAAAADYDGDGRVDLVVSQNGAATRLFRNLGGRPGVRVRLAGPMANPDGVGSRLRIRYADGWGPAREVHMGSGYWSESGSIQVMGIEPGRVVEAVEVTWPDGGRQLIPVDPGTRNVFVRHGV